jgi:hypothetical protein
MGRMRTGRSEFRTYIKLCVMVSSRFVKGPAGPMHAYRGTTSATDRAADRRPAGAAARPRIARGATAAPVAPVALAVTVSAPKTIVVTLGSSSRLRPRAPAGWPCPDTPRLPSRARNAMAATAVG